MILDYQMTAQSLLLLRHQRQKVQKILRVHLAQHGMNKNQSEYESKGVMRLKPVLLII